MYKIPANKVSKERYSNIFTDFVSHRLGDFHLSQHIPCPITTNLREIWKTIRSIR